MKSRLIIALVAFGLIASVSGLAMQGQAESTTPDFSDKVLVVYIFSESRYPMRVLENAHLEMIGDRLFLCGVGADTRRENDWTKGLTTRIAWSTVTSYHEFTKEEFKAYAAAGAAEEASDKPK